MAPLPPFCLVSPLQGEGLSLSTTELAWKLGLSVVVVLAVLGLRILGRRLLLAAEMKDLDRRLRWHLRLDQLGALAVALGLLAVWGPELRSIALSALAIAAALVIAGKELIMCVSGFAVRSFSESYSVGDRIEIAGLRGDVIRYGLLTTTLLEIGPAHQKTGRTVVFPNSMLLSERVVNETSTHAFVLHTFIMPLPLDHDWQRAERELKRVALKHAGKFREAARKHMTESARLHGLEPPNVEVVVSLQVPEAEKLNLLVRIPAPARQKGRVERLIMREFLQCRYPAADDAPERSTPD